MRLISRNDTSLVVGLIAGTIIVFQQPLRFVWDAAADVQQRYHVDLVPALTIFCSVFIFHQYRKRQQARSDAALAAADAVQARSRSEVLERLMTFSLGLGNALDASTLQQALWRHLPAFVGNLDCWLLARTADRWEALLQDTTAGQKRPLEELELVAAEALSPVTLVEARVGGVMHGDTLCFPMLAGGTVVGVLGIQHGDRLTSEQRRSLGTGAVLMAIAVRNVQLFLQTLEQGLRDSLTGCFNRGHGMDELDRELKRARRLRHPLSIVMFDVDHFKTINDALGHLRGDDLLRAVGAQLTRVLRSTDIRCRYGGDEFLIILPDTPLLGAQQVAESLRREMETLAMVDNGRKIAVTVSLGIATAVVQTELGVIGLIERADQALYKAKRSGRNRFCVQDSPAAPAVRSPDSSAVMLDAGSPAVTR